MLVLPEVIDLIGFSLTPGRGVLLPRTEILDLFLLMILVCKFLIVSQSRLLIVPFGMLVLHNNAFAKF